MAPALAGVLGLLILLAGGELLVRGSARVAALLGLSPLVIGLTVVAFGTSSPELAVSLSSSLDGRAGLAMGNVVGSNVFNVLFILGASALVAPLLVHRDLIRRETPLLVAVSALLLLAALGGRLSRLEGAALTAGLVVYLGWTFRGSRGTAPEGEELGGGVGSESGEEKPIPAGLAGDLDLPKAPEGTGSGRGLAPAAFGVLAGLALLVLGADWLVDGAVWAARSAGLDEVVIGLTVVAAGTSLPEVATSLIAASRGERDIAVGNVVGSCLFNILGILGLTALVTPGGLPVDPGIVALDLPVMIAAAAACLPVFFTGHLISRAEGALFLAFYAAYVTYLILEARAHAALEPFGTAMLALVIPLVALGLGVSAWRSWRRGRAVG